VHGHVADAVVEHAAGDLVRVLVQGRDPHVRRRVLTGAHRRGVVGGGQGADDVPFRDKPGDLPVVEDGERAHVLLRHPSRHVRQLLVRLAPEHHRTVDVGDVHVSPRSSAVPLSESAHENVVLTRMRKAVWWWKNIPVRGRTTPWRRPRTSICEARSLQTGSPGRSRPRAPWSTWTSTPTAG